MRTSYWLEFWVDPAKYRHVEKVLGKKTEEAPRSIMRFAETEHFDGPQWFEMVYYLDLLEGKYEPLAQQDVKRSDISLWVQCVHEEDSCEINLDPLTLLRLGEEGIKPCINAFRGKNFAEVFAEDMPVKRSVNIEDVWIEHEEDPKFPAGMIEQAEVTVGFDDGSFWSGHFLTFREMKRLLAACKRTGKFMSGGYFWRRNMILIHHISRKNIQKTLVDLLGQGAFEAAFERMDSAAGNDAEGAHNILELSIMHDRDLPISLSELFEVKEHETITTTNFWALTKRFDDEKPLLDYPTFFMDLLEGKYQALSAAGIQRKDIQINWTHQYVGQCNLEFRPEILERMGKNGIGLNLTIRQAARVIARHLE
ncbi:MAG: hypothetical protein AAFR61_15870 [Bacteroidota bacterium]